MPPKGKKGKRGDDSDDEPVVKAKPVEEEPAKGKGKKDKKEQPKKKGGKRGGDSDDDVDPLSAMKKLALSSDDEAASVPSSKADTNISNASKKTAKNAKKDNKKKGGKKGDDSDDDIDPLAAMKNMAQDSDEEEEEAPKPVAPQPKKGNKKEEKKPTKPVVVESENEESEAEEEPVRAPEPVKEKEKEKKSKKDKKDKDREPEAEVAVPQKSLREIESEANAAKKAAKNVAAAQSAAAAAPVSNAPALDPNRKMSKLELKLEKARKEKAEADAAAVIAAAEAEALRKQEAAEEAARAKQEAIERAEEAARQKAAKAAAGADEESSDEDSDSDEEDSADESTANKGPKSAEEIAKEARMLSTMYGDEVFSEHARPDQDESGGAEGAAPQSGKKEKLSNKAKRKLAKEAESKEREAEFNEQALKASAEGAQFAVSQSIVDVNDPMWQNALDIIIPNVSISAHKKELFVNAELSIVHGRRYGLVGPNGAGKSTLLKMIASGQLKIPPRIDYLYVEQEVMADDTPAVDAVLRADKVRWELIQEEKKIMKALESGGANDALDTRLGEVHAELALIGAASAESRARRILFGLGFDGEMQTRPTRFFSGGWRMRISLARALFIEPTLLMLDEPTNHLDLNAVIWLDDYLQRWKKTLLIVSHDQEFLNSVCEEIIHLEEKKLIFYKGNYDNFKEQEAVRRKQVQKEWEKQEKKLRELKAKGVTQKNAEKAQLKSKSREPGARAKKAEAAAAASGGMESGESQMKLIERPRDYSVVFSFPEVVPLSPPIMEVRDVNFQYAPTLPWLFRGLNFGLDMNSRVCIVGPNGSGKSTIIKLITNELIPPEGEVRRNPRLRVGVYNQHFVERLPMDEDPVTYLRRLFNEETYQSVRNKLGKYGLEGHAHTLPIRDLSGGQKARVVFVELSFMAPHLLFLDEPTNNLDIESIDALCIALREFKGGVVLVSHDARLIETTECQLWVVENQGLTPWEEGFNNYRQYLLKQLEEQLNAIMPGSGERPK